MVRVTLPSLPLPDPTPDGVVSPVELSLQKHLISLPLETVMVGHVSRGATFPAARVILAALYVYAGPVGAVARRAASCGPEQDVELTIGNKK